MDTKQQKAPATTPRTVKARVKPNNNYAQSVQRGVSPKGKPIWDRVVFAPGEIVEVDPSELEANAHAIESLDAEKQRIEEEAKPSEEEVMRLKVLADRRAALFAQRDAAMEGRQLARERAAARLSASLEAGK